MARRKILFVSLTEVKQIIGLLGIFGAGLKGGRYNSRHHVSEVSKRCAYWGLKPLVMKQE